MFDVIVVGGNLSGAAAAIKAANNDVSVALIERNKEPLYPAHCGEASMDTSKDWLNFDKIKCEINEISQMSINVSFKKYQIKFKNHRPIVFDRAFFERKLLEEVRKKDVKLLLGTRLIGFKSPNDLILYDKNTIKGKVIIDATGISCKIGKKIGIDAKLKPNDVGICIQSRVKGNFDKNTIKFWYHKPYAPFGYAWLFPKSDELANIGIGIPGGNNIDISKLLDKYIVDMTKGDYEIINTFRDCVPIGPPLKTLVKDNIMIVGDAARLVNAPTGAGIDNALFSGSLAGLIASNYITGKTSSLKTYEIFLKKKIKILNKAYKNKNKALKSDKIYFKKYNRAIFMLSHIHRLIPNKSEKMVSKRLEKDRMILKSLGDKPFFS